LINRGGMADRTFGLKYWYNQRGLQMAVSDSYFGYTFAPFLNLWDKNMNDLDDNIYPLNKDMHEYYQVTFDFIEEYVKIYYDGKEIQDKELNAFYTNYKKDLKIDGEVFKDNDIDSFIEFMTNIVCKMTAWHEHVGQAFDYWSIDPKWLDTKLYPHRVEQSKNDWALISTLVIFTGFRNPKLKNDWIRVLLNDKNKENATKALNEWQDNLTKLEALIDERNKHRRMPLMSCNPRILECSVSI